MIQIFKYNKNVFKPKKGNIFCMKPKKFFQSGGKIYGQEFIKQIFFSLLAFYVIQR